MMALFIRAHGGSVVALRVNSMHRKPVRESLIPFIGKISLKVTITYGQQKWKYAHGLEKVTKNERSLKTRGEVIPVHYEEMN